MDIVIILQKCWKMHFLEEKYVYVIEQKSASLLKALDLQRIVEERINGYDVAQLEKIGEEIEQELQNSLEREISTEHVGELVMDKLKDLEAVAYVRFASVYREFKDVNTFIDEIKKILDR